MPKPKKKPKKIYKKEHQLDIFTKSQWKLQLLFYGTDLQLAPDKKQIIESYKRLPFQKQVLRKKGFIWIIKED